MISKGGVVGMNPENKLAVKGESRWSSFKGKTESVCQQLIALSDGTELSFLRGAV